ncbi:VOC family protein [Nocardia sp. 004]|uniref:VOC family protein n=1 Tax=Nocardia sp. 004 TaxID=3385978 RepID=UPI0039A046B8
MSEYFSPVPVPARDAAAPEIYREIYGMPMFATIPTSDLAVSKEFWTRGLGFIDLFSVPGQLTHLRRWAFQDVLLVPGDRIGETPALRISFSCVLGQLEETAARCAELVPGCTDGPSDTPWNSTDLTIVTPENIHVVMTAARPLDPHSAQADSLRAMGIEVPQP